MARLKNAGRVPAGEAGRRSRYSIVISQVIRSPFSTGVHSRLSSSLQFQANQASTFHSRVNRSGLAEGANGGIWRLIAERPSEGCAG